MIFGDVVTAGSRGHKVRIYNRGGLFPWRVCRWSWGTPLYSDWETWDEARSFVCVLFGESA